MSALASIFTSGVAGSRPAASGTNKGFFYFATDTNGGTWYQSDGVSWNQRLPPAGLTGMTLIQRTVSTDSTHSSITFSSISAGFNALRIRLIGQNTGSNNGIDVQMQLNSDTGSNYITPEFFLNGTGGIFTTGVATTFARVGTIGGFAGNLPNRAAYMNIEIPEYTSTTWKKTWFTTMGAQIYFLSSGGFQPYIAGGAWNNTAAINQITLFLGSNNFQVGTVANLYGII